jgi:hypothetical protein
VLDARTLEILAAIKTAAVCTPDLRQLLETTNTTTESVGPERVATVEVQGMSGNCKQVGPGGSQTLSVGQTARPTTVFRPPRPQQQVPDFRASTHLIGCCTCDAKER